MFVSHGKRIAATRRLSNKRAWLLVLPTRLPLAVQSLGESALGEKRLLQLLQLSVQKVAGLVHEADERVGRSLRLRGLDLVWV
jgi:hypothetical protein